MKIVATLTDVAGVVHANGSPESRSYIIEIPNENVPQPILDHINYSEDKITYSYLYFSVLK